jgi:hypothetical protein
MTEKGHVPDANLARYRRLRELTHLISRMGNMVSGLGEHGDANVLWAMAGKYKRMANELRVDLPDIKERLREQLQAELPNVAPDQIDSLMKMAEDAGRQIGKESE